MTIGAGAVVVVPTYNEAATIGPTIERIRRAVPHGRVLVVDDASPDGTADVVEAAAARLGNVSLLSRPGKEGLGAAYVAGFRHALQDGCATVVQMDADGSHDAAALPELLRRCEDGADVVIGSRYVPGASIGEWPRRRAALSRAGNAYAARMLGLDVRDATSGFRAYRTALFDRLDLHAVRSSGYCFQVELTYRAARAGARIEEMPIRFVDRIGGSSKMSSAIVREAFVHVSRWGLARRLDV